MSRIVKLHNDTGGGGGMKTSRKGRCGKKKKTIPRDDALILRISVMDPKKTSSDILLECGHRARCPIKKKLFDTPNEEEKAVLCEKI